MNQTEVAEVVSNAFTHAGEFGDDYEAYFDAIGLDGKAMGKVAAGSVIAIASEHDQFESFLRNEVQLKGSLTREDLRRIAALLTSFAMTGLIAGVAIGRHSVDS